jgi:hypothetical protein
MLQISGSFLAAHYDRGREGRSAAIAGITKRIVEQQNRIKRLTAENQPTDTAIELLCALLDSMRVQEDKLQILRASAKVKKESE